jgi:hypothetical protein
VEYPVLNRHPQDTGKSLVKTKEEEEEKKMKKMLQQKVSYDKESDKHMYSKEQYVMHTSP